MLKSKVKSLELKVKKLKSKVKKPLNSKVNCEKKL